MPFGQQERRFGKSISHHNIQNMAMRYSEKNFPILISGKNEITVKNHSNSDFSDDFSTGIWPIWCCDIRFNSSRYY